MYLNLGSHHVGGGLDPHNELMTVIKGYVQRVVIDRKRRIGIRTWVNIVCDF